MSYKIIPTKTFEKEFKILLKKYPSLKNDMGNLGELLQEKPQTGIALGYDCYKIRLAIKSKGKGKSGGGRLITCARVEDQKIYLISIYDKSEQETIRDKKLVYYLKLSGLL